ncbi:MAG: Lipoprotein releasing system transmembrane protein LolC [uncultured Campylobacterales bacterium]|uniref:Lipoprotein releasing system transmembrane protein LolC n=1 Tax=uncultured Campylobacterales bacterium TaxID=352960 RepID=A0A6S6RX66_9BACT|nr:MAG: Lipoprotein releasing system transmembrane protein LolC [uncultured Campylobacterales bacterium]
MNIVIFLVKKYLKFDKSQPFISVSAILAFLGVCIGILVLVVTMAVMNGLSKEFEKKLFAMNYPLTLKGYDRLINDEDLQVLKSKFPDLKISPYINIQAIVKSGSQMQGALVYGVDFDSERQVNSIVKESLDDMNISKVGRFETIIGNGFKKLFFVENRDKVLLMFTNMQTAGFSMMPKMKNFTIANSFSSGIEAYDLGYVYVNIQDLRKVLGYKQNTYSGVHLYSDDIQKDKTELIKAFGNDVQVIAWWEYNASFFAALQTEKKAMFIILMMIVLVASLNIISTLLMMVMSRRKEISLLVSLGATTKEIKKIFFYVGIVIGGSGIFIGLILSGICLYILSNFDIISLPADVYPTATLPIELSALDLGYIIVCSIVVVILSSLYPAHKASKTDVLKVLRNE